MITRRKILKTTAAAGAILALPATHAVAQYPRVRKSLEGSNVMKDLENYKKAVTAMLALPPSDRRNWYRNSMIHLLDCPHGNWWFLVWHRGYLGWFERTCRELCGDETFSLPFWDWTKETKVPAGFWDDVLDPSTSGYIPDLASFRTQIKPEMQTYWNSFTSAQLQQEQERGFANFDAFWQQAEGSFTNGSSALTRGLTSANPNLSTSTKANVQLSTINNLLAADRYVTDTGGRAFDTALTANHHGFSGSFSILEGQPHNSVHGNINGLMGRFLSPIDPIFFMHHGNIDRLWDVWTRKQQKAGLSADVPPGLTSQFNAEQFLFYTDENNSSPSKSSAGDYFEIGDFNYSYEPGSGEDTPAPLLAAAMVETANSGTLSMSLGIGKAATATLSLPKSIAKSAPSASPALVADITIEPPMNADGLVYNVFVHAKGAPVNLDVEGPGFAGSFSFFGTGHHKRGPSTFAIAISDAVNKLKASGALDNNQSIEVAVIADTVSGEVPLAADSIEVQLQSVKIGAL